MRRVISTGLSRCQVDLTSAVEPVAVLPYH